MTNLHNVIKKYHGDEPYEPEAVKDDYKEFKDYTYDVKMNIKDINYLLEVLNDFGRMMNGAWCAKARFWKLLLDSGVQLEVKEKAEKCGSSRFTYERMFARPPFGCTKGRDKSSCELDYFACNSCPVAESFSIVTNPPYSCANQFILHTLSVVKPDACCVFLPVRYLEGTKRYNEIYSRFKPSKVLVYAKRLGCYKESDVEAGVVTERGVGSAVAYMWLCFTRGTWSSQETKMEVEWVL